MVSPMMSHVDFKYTTVNIQHLYKQCMWVNSLLGTSCCNVVTVDCVHAFKHDVHWIFRILLGECAGHFRVSVRMLHVH